MMKNTISLMKTLSMGLFIGAFVALLSLVGSSAFLCMESHMLHNIFI